MRSRLGKPQPYSFLNITGSGSFRISIYPNRKHPDVRIARRASTIASLARVISERKVSRGLRATLLKQAKRLERLAEERLKEFPKVEDEQDED